MIAFDVAVNGREVCLAAIGEKGVLSAMVTWVVPSSVSAEAAAGETTLHVGGLAGLRHYTWIPFQQLKVGDVVSIKIVEVSSAENVLARATVETVPEGKPGWFNEVRARLRKADR